MFSLSSYVLSIAGIVILGVLIRIILPDGAMNKYVNNIFALIIVFVIVSPLPNLINSDINLEDVFETSSTQINENFIYIVNTQTVNQLESSLKTVLEEEGYSSVEVTITADVLATPINLQKITIDLSNLVINEELGHINMYNKIKQIILNNIYVEEEKIVFYG